MFKARMMKEMIFFLLMILCAGMVFAYNSDYKNIGDSESLFVDVGNPTCSDAYTRAQANDGNTPWCNLTTAITNLQSGDVIYVFNGTYNNQHTISHVDLTEKTTIKAYPGEAPVLSAYYERFTEQNALWTNLSNASLNYWSAELSEAYYTVYATFADSTPLFVYDTWDLFTSDYFNYTGIYLNDTADKIYIKFENTTANPNNIPLYFSEYGNAIGNQAALAVYDVNGAILEIDGFTIKNGGRFAFYIANSNYIHLINSYLHGGEKVVYITGTTAESSHNVVANNEVECGFDSDWGWQAAKSEGGRRQENTGIYLQAVDYNNKVNNNEVHNCFNGVVDGATALQYADNYTQVFNNEVHDIYDDALEIEDFEIDSRWYNNTVYDAFVSVSLAYGNCTGGNCYMFRNSLTADKVIKYNWTQNWVGGCFKIGRDSKPLIGWDIYHNTCYYIANNSRSYSDGARGLVTPSVENSTFINNIFYGYGLAIANSGLASAGAFYDYNAYYSTIGNPIFSYWNNYTDSTKYDNISQAQASSNWDGTWDVHSIDSNPLLNTTNRVFTLQAGSSLLGAGISLESYGFEDCIETFGNPDIGMVEDYNGEECGVIWGRGFDCDTSKRSYINNSYDVGGTMIVRGGGTLTLNQRVNVGRVVITGGSRIAIDGGGIN